MTRSKTSAAPVLPRIFTIRRLKVVLDADLAKLYGVPTSRLNEAVKRNAVRFPNDFSFVVTREELVDLKSQFAIPRSGAPVNSRSLPASLKSGHGGARSLSRAFIARLQPLLDAPAPDEDAEKKPKIGFHPGNR
jgi:hypothetical protein